MIFGLNEFIMDVIIMWRVIKKLMLIFYVCFVFLSIALGIYANAKGEYRVAAPLLISSFAGLVLTPYLITRYRRCYARRTED